MGCREMLSKLKYYSMRAMEAGIIELVAKLLQKIRPFLYWPFYASSQIRATGVSERLSLRDFGKLSETAFIKAGKADSSRARRVDERLNLALDSDFKVLGYGPITKPKGVDWHADSIHGHLWKAKYFPFCDFISTSTRADVKIPWEVNRLHWLVWLAEAAVNAEPIKRAELVNRFLETIYDWSNANPVGYGINWACGMEVAIRGVNLAVSSGVFAQYLDDKNIDLLCSILRAHQVYLHRFPENSDVPGNHYLADIMGEVILHAALDGLSSYPTSLAFDSFFRVAESQFEKGGCHIERSTVYHRLTIDMMSMPFALALRAGNCNAKPMALLIERATQFIAQITSESGRIPVFGDQDSGFVLWFGESAQVVDRRLCKAEFAPDTDLYSFIDALSGEGDFFPKVCPKSGQLSGFATLSSGASRVTIKTGEQGLKGRAPHDHDDALSVCACWGKDDLLIDPGCHSYTLDPTLRRDAIISSRHNAPTPLLRERFNPTQGSINATVRGAVAAKLVCYDSQEMTGRINLKHALSMAITRHVSLDAGLHIFDSWHFEQTEAARIFWLIDPVWTVEAPTEIEVPSEGLTLRFVSANKTLIANIKAEAAYFRCKTDYYSPDYGSFAKCTALEITTLPARSGEAELHINSDCKTI